MADMKPIIKQVAAGHWPATLTGQDLIDVLVLIDKGMESADWFEIVYEEAVNDEEINDTLRRETARLCHVELGTFLIEQDYRGDPEVVADYLEAKTQAPPVFIIAGKLRDGHHRCEVARRRGEASILAYVID